MIGSTNPNASNVMLEVFQESDPWYVVIRESIRDHRADERDPVSMGSNPDFLRASGRKRRIMIYGPKRRPLELGDPCPECGYEFDPDEWECREVGAGSPTVGQTWHYTCPGCELETATIGT